MTAAPTKEPFRLFISYAHADDAIKTRLLKHLDPLEGEGYIELWEDGAIPLGSKWREEIGTAMDWADGALFLVSADFLASEFCKSVEVPHFLKRYQEDQNVALIFVLVDDCMWKVKPYIEERQILPPKAKPIKAHGRRDKAYTAIAEAVHRYVESAQPRAPKRAPTKGKTSPAALTLPALLAKLPGATAHLFGREAELKQLDEWRDHKGVILWVADGGTGKSALLRKWLETQNWQEGTRFIGHSFYSQGSHNQATSARGFFLDALKQLAVPHEEKDSDDELGRLLAVAAAQAPTVLVLDGMEPLQQASDDPKLNGILKDRGLEALLDGLAHAPGQAVCLAGSRLPLPEGRIADGNDFRQKHLKLLPPGGAQELLRQRGVRGADEELAKMAQRCGHHPLALILAAEFCHTYLQDSAAEFLQKNWAPKPGASHAATVMAWFDAALADEHQALDRELACILGLFDRPAPWGALMALKAADPIPGVSERLHDADEATLFASLARLSQWGLLDADLTRKEPDLDAHPLVREHFGKLLEEQDPAAWRAAHGVLFAWFCAVPEKKQPDTLEELEPLYQAVGHGCKAGRYLTALDEVYLERIQRGQRGYSLFQLGAYSADLAALAGFFPDGWDHPPVAAEAGLPRETLSEADRSWLLAAAAFCLMSLGRLEEALGPRRMAIQTRRETGDWDNFCISSENLADLLAPLGRWVEAEAASREALDAAALITDPRWRWQRSVNAHTTLGRAHHGQGRLAQAREDYRQAEELQVQARPYEPKLYSIYGYGYAQLLLEQTAAAAGWHEVLERGEYALEIASGRQHLLSIALDHCTIGQVRAALGDPAAATALDRAVATMQRAGSILNQPPMHLARAQYRRSQRDFPAAWEDHEVAYSISRRGNMRTYLAECALLAGNLHLDEGDAPKAAAQYAEAAQLIREDGYGRREAELRLLHTRVLHAQHDPAAPTALAAAEARIRETGQWFFWRELRAVAGEIGADDPGECPAAG